MPERSAGTILVVDDHALIRTLTDGILRGANYRVEQAGDGAAALDRLRQGGIDLVLLDLELPDQHGTDVARAWRAEESPNQDRVIIVALTASTRTEDRRACLEAGMDDHLGKPIIIDRLLAVMARHLGRERREPGAVSGVTIALTGQGRREFDKARLPIPRFPTPPPGAPPIVDQEVWARLAAETKHTDPTLVDDLLRQFLDQAPKLIDTVAEGLAKRDVERARSAAHRLKGAAATIGFMALGETAARCEKLLKSGELEDAASVLAEMRAAMSRSVESPALRTRMSRLG